MAILSWEESQLLVEFAYQPNLFHMTEGEQKRQKLKQLMANHWNEVQSDINSKLRYLCSLILHCPQFLERPEGYEWIADKYKVALFRSLSDPQYCTALRNSFIQASEELQTGHATLAVEYDRARVF